MQCQVGLYFCRIQSKVTILVSPSLASRAPTRPLPTCLVKLPLDVGSNILLHSKLFRRLSGAVERVLLHFLAKSPGFWKRQTPRILRFTISNLKRPIRKESSKMLRIVSGSNLMSAFLMTAFFSLLWEGSAKVRKTDKGLASHPRRHWLQRGPVRRDSTRNESAELNCLSS